MSDLTQNITEHAMSPQCFHGQHDACKRELAFMGEDGVGRTLICPCRCHDKPPVAVPSEAKGPEIGAYRLTYEYEEAQKTESGEELRAWVKRGYITDSRVLAQNWLDGIIALMETARVRNVAQYRLPGEWEKVG